MPSSKSNSSLTGPPNIGVCAHANLRKAMRVVSKAYDAALKPSGLRATQFTLLAVLGQRGEMPLTRLAELLVMDRTTLTRNLKPLVKKGWLAIGRDADERVRLISTTEMGRSIVAEATPLWRNAQASVAEDFGEPRMVGMIDDLAALAEVIRAE